MDRIVLDELSREGVVVDFDDAVIDAFAAFGLVRFERTLAGTTMLPNGLVGAVRVDGVQVEVHPKDRVPIASLFFILGYAADPGYLPEQVSVAPDADLFEVIAEALVRQAELALSGGPLSGYVQTDETARTIRGRIRLSDQVMRHRGLAYPVEVTFDDFSIDIAENRILLTALRRLEGIPRFRRDLAGRIDALAAALDGVTSIERGAPLPRWQATRLNARCHGALRLAEMVLRHQSIRLGPASSLDAAGFVVNMAKAYEDFVGTALREALAPYGGSVETQFRTTMDEHQPGVSPVVLIPDVVWRRREAVLAVADAKYKAASWTGDYPNADKYQMLAYCTALGVRRAWLVYAQGGEPTVRRVRNSDVEIVEWPLDLSSSPQSLLRQVAALIESMAVGGLPFHVGSLSKSGSGATQLAQEGGAQ